MRNQLVEDVVRSFGNRIYIFGGYVRDLVAGIEPNDIDIWVPNSDTKERFILELARRTPVQIMTGFSAYQTVSLSVPELGVDHIDITLMNDMRPDVNVNRLHLLPMGNILRAAEGYDIFQIIQDIHNRNFRSEVGISSLRRGKLLNKGWTELPGEDTREMHGWNDEPRVPIT